MPLRIIILLTVLSAGYSAAQDSTNITVFFSSTYLEPRGIYGSDASGDTGLTYLYPLYSPGTVFSSSYPVVSPKRTVFARFQEGPGGRFLVIRSVTDGSVTGSYQINGYNPQWFPDGEHLFYETPASNSENDCWKINTITGEKQKIGTLSRQYYPPSNLSGAALLSPGGTKIIYIKSGSGFIAPYIFDISSQTESPLFRNDSSGFWNNEFHHSMSFNSAPAMPLTVRHLRWSPDERNVVVYGTTSYEIGPAKIGKEGIFVITVGKQEVISVFHTTNISTEHPERYFFTPDNRQIIFTIDGMNNTRNIMRASATQPLSAVSIAAGDLIAGVSSQEVWVLSPISYDGSALLYQERTKSHLMKYLFATGISLRLTPDTLVGPVKISDAQWTNFNAKPPAPDIDVSITKISPIQVIDDVPLVKDRATMVRVFLKLNGKDTLDEVAVKLTIGADEQIQRVRLRKYNGETFVFPVGSSPIEQEAERYFAQNRTDDIIREIKMKGYLSCNFDTPYYPKTLGDLTFTAVVDPLDELSETDEDNNITKRIVTVKKYASDKPFTFHFMLGRNALGKGHTLTAKQIHAKCEPILDYVAAVYPIPDIRYTWTPFIYYFTGINSFDPIVLGGLVGKFLTGDFDSRLVFFMPNNSIEPFFPGEIDGLAMINGNTILLDEVSASAYTLAHEFGHTLGLYHDDSPTAKFGDVAGDGWDVLHLTSSSPASPKRSAIISGYPNNPTSNFNYYSLMGGGTAWISRSEYYHFLNRFVSGGRDPHLLHVRGIRSSSATRLLPCYEYDAVLEPIITSTDTAEALDADNNVLAVRPFNTTKIRSSDSLLIAVDIEIPSGTTKIRLRDSIGIYAERIRSANRPLTSFHPIVNITSDSLRLTWDAIDADGDTMYHTLFYSSQTSPPILIAGDLNEASYSLSTADLPGAEFGQFIVITTDGFNTTSAYSATINVPNKPPDAFIITPSVSDTIPIGSPVECRAAAYDPESGMLTDTLIRWFSDDQGFLGKGRRIFFTPTKSTKYLSIETTDPAGNQAFDSVDLNLMQSVNAKRRPLDISVYPNPSSGDFTIRIELDQASDVTLELFDPLGRLILRRTERSVQGMNELHLKRPSEKIHQGTYYLKVSSPAGAAIQTIIVE